VADLGETEALRVEAPAPVEIVHVVMEAEDAFDT
jgi:hypothetical protein